MKINKFNLIIFFGLSLLINFNLKSMDSPGADSRGAKDADVESGFAGAVAPGAMVRQGTSGIKLGGEEVGPGDVAFDGSKDAGEILIGDDGAVTGLTDYLRARRGGPFAPSATRSAAASDGSVAPVDDDDAMRVIGRALQDSSRIQAEHLAEYKKENDEQRVREACSRRMAVTGVVLSVAAFGLQVGTMIWGNGEDA